jgi:hypothetical protein
VFCYCCMWKPFKCHLWRRGEIPVSVQEAEQCLPSLFQIRKLFTLPHESHCNSPHDVCPQTSHVGMIFRVVNIFYWYMRFRTSNAEVKNAWSFTSTPPYVFMAWRFVK